MHKLEYKEEDATAGQVAPGVMITPALGEDFWYYRVKLTDIQAILAFPKFGTIGIGFAQEEDWNTNLPYRCTTQEIYSHIKKNKSDDSISDVECLAAIALIQTACHRLRRTDETEMETGFKE